MDSKTPPMDAAGVAVFLSVYSANHEFGMACLPDPHQWETASALEEAGFLKCEAPIASPQKGAKGYIVTEKGVNAYNSSVEFAARPTIDPTAPSVIEVGAGGPPKVQCIADLLSTEPDDSRVLEHLDSWDKDLRKKDAYGLVATYDVERLAHLAKKHRHESSALGFGGRLFFAVRLNALNWSDALSRAAESCIPRLAAIVDNGVDAMDLTSVEHVYCTEEIPDGDEDDPPPEEKSWAVDVLDGRAWVRFYDGDASTNKLSWVLVSEGAVKESQGYGLKRLRENCEDAGVPLLVSGEQITLDTSPEEVMQDWNRPSPRQSATPESPRM